MKIESIQDLQTNTTKQIDSVLAIIDQMTYDHRTKSTPIEQLTATAKEQARQIKTSNQIIGDQTRQLAILNSEMKNFEGYKQKFDDNTKLIEPLSTSISAIQTSRLV